MHKNIILWISALVITFVIGYLNSVTGSGLPLSGTFGIEGNKITYRFDTEYDGKQPVPVTIRTDIDSIKGIILFREESAGVWDTSVMKYNQGMLEGSMEIKSVPRNAEYRAELYFNGKTYKIPNEGTVHIKVLSATSPLVKGLFWFCLLFGLFLSTRTGLEYFADTMNEKKHGMFTAIFFILYGFVVSPLLTSYQKGAISHNVPSPAEIWSVNHLILPLLWIAALIIMFNSRHQKITALVTAIVSLFLFIILH